MQAESWRPDTRPPQADRQVDRSTADRASRHSQGLAGARPALRGRETSAGGFAVGWGRPANALGAGPARTAGPCQGRGHSWASSQPAARPRPSEAETKSPALCGAAEVGRTNESRRLSGTRTVPASQRRAAAPSLCWWAMSADLPHPSAAAALDRGRHRPSTRGHCENYWEGVSRPLR